MSDPIWKCANFSISRYIDFSVEIQNRRTMFTSAKRHLNYKYAMLYPAWLKVLADNKSHWFTSAQEVFDWLESRPRSNSRSPRGQDRWLPLFLIFCVKNEVFVALDFMRPCMHFFISTNSTLRDPCFPYSDYWAHILVYRVYLMFLGSGDPHSMFFDSGVGWGVRVYCYVLISLLMFIFIHRHCFWQYLIFLLFIIW